MRFFKEALCLTALVGCATPAPTPDYDAIRRRAAESADSVDVEEARDKERKKKAEEAESTPQ